MTENQWPQTPNPATSGTYGAGMDADNSFPASGSPETTGTSRTQAAKEEASNVAGHAASAAQDVAQTARSEAANVAAEAKSSAQDLLHQARTGLTDQAGAQQQKAAEGIRNISGQLQSMADAPDQQGIASDLIRQAAQGTSTVASWLENRDPGSILNEVQTFARNRPGTFLLLAAGAGVLAGRLTRSLTAGAPGSPATSTSQAASPGVAGGTVPPPPVQLPGSATTTAGYDGGSPGSGYGEPAHPASPLDSPQLVEEPWSGNRIADDPLADNPLADDPFGNDPRTRDRSADGQSGGLR